MRTTPPEDETVQADVQFLRYLNLQIEHSDSSIHDYETLVDIELSIMDLLGCHCRLRSLNNSLLFTTFSSIRWRVELDLEAETVEFMLDFPLRCVHIYLTVDHFV